MQLADDLDFICASLRIKWLHNFVTEGRSVVIRGQRVSAPLRLLDMQPYQSRESTAC